MKRSLEIAFAIAVTITILTMGQALYAGKPQVGRATAAQAQRVACCVVTAIGSPAGVVTAKENATGRTFEFQVTSPKLSAQIHVGMPVYANFSTMQVSLNGTADCCKIISISLPPVAVAPAPAPKAALGAPGAVAPVTAPGAAPMAVGGIQNKLAPAQSGTITALNTYTGVVTATENATGRSFTFQIAHFQPIDGAKLFQTFKVGGKVDFQSIDGAALTSGSNVRLTVQGFQPIDGIVASTSSAATSSAATSSAATSSAAKSLAAPTTVGRIAAFDINTGIVTATENATGQTFRFMVKDRKLAGTLQAGVPVGFSRDTGLSVQGFAGGCCTPIHHHVDCSLTPSACPGGGKPKKPIRLTGSFWDDLNDFCGDIGNCTDPTQMGPPTTPPASTSSAATSAPAKSLAAPMAAGEVQNKPAPNCTITAMDINTGVVTATENATSKSFQFKLNDATQLKSLDVGKGVYANFAAGVVSLDGIMPNGTILSVAAAPATAGTAVGAIRNNVAPVQPFFTITAFDANAGVVTATENATGRSFTFQIAHFQPIDGAKMSQTFAVGGQVDFQPIDGAVLTSGSNARLTVQGFQPIDGIVASTSSAATSSAASAATSRGADLQRLSLELPAHWIALTPSAAVCEEVGWGFKDNACYKIPNSRPPRHNAAGGGSGGTPQDRCHNTCQQQANNVGAELWFSGVELDGTCTCGLIMHGRFAWMGYFIYSNGYQFSTAAGGTAPAAGAGGQISSSNLRAPGVNPQAVGIQLGIQPDPNPNHLPDLVLDIGSAMGECLVPAGSSCQASCGSKTVPTNFGVHNLTQYPANGPIKLILTEIASGATRTWTVNHVDGNQWAFSGGFYTYWKCPTGLSMGNVPDNYTLEVQGPPELTTNGKNQQLYIPPDAVMCSGNVGFSGCQQ